ncbi:uncharacterized protein PV09_02982 [Verruconis gallopava]|uniref:HMG box domain-containing protein n=1 Tax=Verruconis gallopava TaxID=253628 RepID=A0A0D1Z0R3_9PEZI|nr:uncharacterized protein PV09_02982 [Verruconis gallopava]KIW06552.1 hypothetical protein PV09_02982 [Verruconis gallopava]
MAHEAYLPDQFGTSQYAESQQAVGLGTQHYDFKQQQTQGFCPDPRSTIESPFTQQGVGTSSSPPTPMSHNSDIRRTRSGRSMVRNDSPHSNVNRSSSTRSNRKKKASANEKHKTPRLTAPLSVLTKDMVDVPVRDMEAWVKRSAEERAKEAEKRNGYITRPMNSFMLYRSAYAERTKMWCLHNNHQVVSSVSGESWPLEPPEVREFYNELAKIERINHQNAHPDYKFSPSKPGTVSGGSGSSGKKRSRMSEEDSELSDVDDPDWAAVSETRSRPSKRAGRDAGYTAHANLSDVQGHFSEIYSRNGSNWGQAVRPLPMSALPYHPISYPQQFYPSPTMQHRTVQMLLPPERQQQGAFGNVLFDNPSMPANQALIGLPGGNHAELLGLSTGFDHQVDPMLLAFNDGNGPGANLDALSAYTSNYEPPNFAAQYRIEHGAGGPLITDYRPKEWVPDSTSPGFENTATEFDKLWDEHELDRRLDMQGEHGLSGDGMADQQSGPVTGLGELVKAAETA